MQSHRKEYEKSIRVSKAHDILSSYECLSIWALRSQDAYALLRDLGENELGKAEYYCKKIVKSKIVSVKRVRDFVEVKCTNGENTFLCEEFLNNLSSIEKRSELLLLILRFLQSGKWERIADEVEASLEYAEIEAKSEWTSYDYDMEIVVDDIITKANEFVLEWNNQHRSLPAKAISYKPKDSKPYKLVLVFWLTTGHGKRPVVKLNGKPRLEFIDVSYTTTFAIRFKDKFIEISKNLEKMGTQNVRRFVESFLVDVLGIKLGKSTIKERISQSVRNIVEELSYKERELKELINLIPIKEKLIDIIENMNVDADIKRLVKAIIEDMRLIRLTLKEEIVRGGKRETIRAEASSRYGLDEIVRDDRWRKVIEALRSVVETGKLDSIDVQLKLGFNKKILDETTRRITFIEISTSGSFSPSRWLRYNYSQLVEILEKVFMEYSEVT